MFTTIAITASFISILVLWWALFTLFTRQSRTQIACAVTIIILFSIPLITQFAFRVCAEISRIIFSIDESGEVQLAYSPMRIPDSYKGKDYCNRFTDEKGQPLDITSYREDGVYCGTFWKMYEKKVIFLPYKNLPNGKTIYWASPDLRIISPPPSKIK